MNRLRALGVGAETVKDWLGAGGVPVDPAQASHRSQSCIAGDNGKPCPHNEDGNWWDRIAAGAVVIIMSQRRAKDALSIRIPEEYNLHFCSICHCKLETKIHVPMEHIASYTPKDVWDALPDYCWMKKEQPK